MKDACTPLFVVVVVRPSYGKKNRGVCPKVVPFVPDLLFIFGNPVTLEEIYVIGRTVY